MKKKSSLILLIILSLFLVTACDEQTNLTQNNKNVIIDNNGEESPIDDSTTSEIIKTGIQKHKVCTREANAGENIDVNLNYDVYYTDDILNLLISQEEIVTDDQETLDEYENAYRKIAKYYENLEYYDQIINRTNNSVLYKTTINYDKIDIQKLLDIEGEEDNIIKNKEAKVELYLSLLKKFGGTCEDVE